jgi:hypothetical protein
MKLNVPERLALLSVLDPTIQGNLVTLRVVRDLQRELSFSEDEIRDSGLKTMENGGTSWQRDIMKDVLIGDAARGVILAQFKKLDAAGSLNMFQLPVYERFLEEPK